MRRWLWLPPFLALSAVGCGPHRSRASQPPPMAATPASPRPLRLIDVTGRSGVRFRHHNGAFGRKWFPETNGAGAAIFDYDGDGWPDLFLVNDRDWSPPERQASHLPPGPAGAATTSCLFRNKGDGTFEHVTHAVGLDLPMYGMGCAVGDYNNDGCPDLYVSGVGRGWLFRNEGGRRFQEAAGPAGVEGTGWGAGRAWGGA